MTQRTESIQIGNYAMAREVLNDLTKLMQPFPVLELEREGEAAVDMTQDPSESLESKFKFITRIKPQRGVLPLKPPRWKDDRKLTHEWKMLAREHNTRTGFDGALFEAKIDGKPHYFIYNLCSDDTGDVATIGKMVNGKRPVQTANAKLFMEESMATIHKLHPEKNVPIVHVGYSLGGAITEMLEREGRPTVVFDSPPASAVLDKEGVPQEKRDLNLLTVMGPHDGLYNCHGKHNGQILVAGDKYWKTDHVSFYDFFVMNSSNHFLGHIGKSLEKMDEWKPFPAEEWKRSTDLFDAFATYLDDNTQGRKLKWDEAKLVKEVKKLQEPQNRAKAQKFALFLFGALSDALDVAHDSAKDTRKFTKALREERYLDSTIHPDVIDATQKDKSAAVSR